MKMGLMMVAKERKKRERGNKRIGVKDRGEKEKRGESRKRKFEASD
jgi:hypothetical protein